MRLMNGPYKGMTGQICHIYRGWVFVHSRMCPENSGMIVAKSKDLIRTEVDHNTAGCDSGLLPSDEKLIRKIGSDRRGGRFGPASRRRGQHKNNDRSMIGKAVRITSVSSSQLYVLTILLLFGLS